MEFVKIREPHRAPLFCFIKTPLHPFLLPPLPASTNQPSGFFLAITQKAELEGTHQKKFRKNYLKHINQPSTNDEIPCSWTTQPV